MVKSVAQLRRLALLMIPGTLADLRRLIPLGARSAQSPVIIALCSTPRAQWQRAWGRNDRPNSVDMGITIFDTRRLDQASALSSHYFVSGLPIWRYPLTAGFRFGTPVEVNAIEHCRMREAVQSVLNPYLEAGVGADGREMAPPPLLIAGPDVRLDMGRFNILNFDLAKRNSVAVFDTREMAISRSLDLCRAGAGPEALSPARAGHLIATHPGDNARFAMQVLLEYWLQPGDGGAAGDSRVAAVDKDRVTAADDNDEEKTAAAAPPPPDLDPRAEKRRQAQLAAIRARFVDSFVPPSFYTVPLEKFINGMMDEANTVEVDTDEVDTDEVDTDEVDTDEVDTVAVDTVAVDTVEPAPPSETEREGKSQVGLKMENHLADLLDKLKKGRKSTKNVKLLAESGIQPQPSPPQPSEPLQRREQEKLERKRSKLLIKVHKRLEQKLRLGESYDQWKERLGEGQFTRRQEKQALEEERMYNRKLKSLSQQQGMHLKQLERTEKRLAGARPGHRPPPRWTQDTVVAREGRGRDA